MINKTLTKIFLYSSITLFFSCSGKGGKDDTDFFLNDKNQIGMELADQELGIKFNPPKDWELTSSSLSRKIENKANPSDGFIYQPIYLFFNSSSRGVLSAGKVVPTDSSLIGSAKLNYYKNFLAGKYKNANLSLSSFANAKINFTQVKFEKENLVSYKIFFQNSRNEIIQFEYSVRKELLQTSLIQIKSSVGSIRSL